MLLECSNITKSFGERKLFSGLSFSVDKGECLAIMGRNGCGKSTLLKVLLGSEECDSGFVKKDDVKVAYLEQQDEAQEDRRSGGERTKDRLDGIFDKKPSIMILDEPTNHLDMETLDWLAVKLKSFKGALILVSHDRYLIDQVATQVLDLNTDPARLYKGNYTSFLEQKSVLLKTNENMIKKTEDKIRHEKAVIEKLKSFNREKSIKRAESREKMLAKIDRPDKITDEKTRINLVLEPAIVSGKDVMKIEGLKKSFGERVLFSDVDFYIGKGEHVGLIGGNGTGKSTLFSIIRDIEPKDSGSIKIGANVEIGYYDQTLSNFDENATLFDEIRENYNDLNDTNLRNTLAAFSFYEDDVYKKISSLSGGEKGRLALAKLMLKGANLLLLDEPTNHLDIESKEILEEAINSYTGTVLFISHDRYFLNKCAKRILELRGGHITGYLGNYDEFKKKQQELIDRGYIKEGDKSPPECPVKEINENRLKYREEKKKKALEEKLQRDTIKLLDMAEDIEAKINDINNKMSDPLISSDHIRLTELTEEKDALKEELDILYEKLEKLL